jgi:ribosomal biogenesis protein LAS1
MRPPKIAIWQNNDQEISELKDWFYPENNDDTMIDRRRALARVKAYHIRGSVPHSVDSTSLLTAAILNDIPSNDIDSIRLTYSMAIIRFVNGLLDPYQRAQHAIPLQVLARSLELPSFLVELRHAATHEGLPSLDLLRNAARRSLDWLWRHYWSVSNHDSQESLLEDDENENEKKESIKSLLREWRRIRRSDYNKVVKRGDSSKEGVEYWSLVKKIKESLDQDDQLFIDALFYMNILVPKGKV